MKTSLKILLVVVVGVIAFGAEQLLLNKPEVPATPTPVATSSAQDIVKVTKTDATISKVPMGFPSNIPVDGKNVIESYKADYSSRGVIQYTVSYTSQKSKDDLWTMYRDFMKSHNYAIDVDNSSKSLGQLSAAKDNDTLSIVLSTRSNLSLVQINYLDRK